MRSPEATLQFNIMRRIAREYSTKRSKSASNAILLPPLTLDLPFLDLGSSWASGRGFSLVDVGRVLALRVRWSQSIFRS